MQNSSVHRSGRGSSHWLRRSNQKQSKIRTLRFHESYEKRRRLLLIKSFEESNELRTKNAIDFFNMENTGNIISNGSLGDVMRQGTSQSRQRCDYGR